jgi:hypothetical protein
MWVWVCVHSCEPTNIIENDDHNDDDDDDNDANDDDNDNDDVISDNNFSTPLSLSV